jgi:hypothetical protein
MPVSRLCKIWIAEYKYSLLTGGTGQAKEAQKAGVKVILHKMHILHDRIRLFLTIENMNEKQEITFRRSGLKLFQGKRQFSCLYMNDSSFRNVKETIPAGIEETGVLLFEPLINKQDPIRFHFIFKIDIFDHASADFDVNISWRMMTITRITNQSLLFSKLKLSACEDSQKKHVLLIK